MKILVSKIFSSTSIQTRIPKLAIWQKITHFIFNLFFHIFYLLYNHFHIIVMHVCLFFRLISVNLKWLWVIEQDGCPQKKTCIQSFRKHRSTEFFLPPPVFCCTCLARRVQHCLLERSISLRSHSDRIAGWTAQDSWSIRPIGGHPANIASTNRWA